ncbi:MAG: glycosyltransferase family 2 protein [Myxococcota bacterium]
MISLVIPVYKNSGNIAPLLATLEEVQQKLPVPLEVVFVVDGSPDDSYLRLAAALPKSKLRSQLALLSRNFGAFSAIRAGLELGHGELFAVMAADLQEPPELLIDFVEKLRDESIDVVVARRLSRSDPLMSRLMAEVFWWFYRRLVQPQMPEGGVDAFACRRRVRDQILVLCEQNSSLVGLLYWVGFRRGEVTYERRAREVGTSAWTFTKKLRYLSDSIYGFTDLPIRLLTTVGTVGLILSVLFGIGVAIAKLSGRIAVPGYSATVVLISFFGTLNCLGIGVLGGYLWRTFENTKGRPNYIVASHNEYGAAPPKSQSQPNEPIEITASKPRVRGHG